MFQADVLQEFFGCNSGPIPEQSLKMEWTQVNLFGYFVQIRLLSEIFIDIADCFFDALIVCHDTKIERQKAGGNPFLADMSKQEIRMPGSGYVPASCNRFI